ncbi:hypothetical protein NBRC111894_912 [Sporolactobacillus inulinus]|uniref:Uncharacterized protein n=1 Tax=Sporolactobacillus inulinus TaxID=2078 RepID=A0A4Y1Z8Y7_9BACL|nr:hypothetical protein NBRC111894_912 [Sporolactobacillus inulinus]
MDLFYWFEYTANSIRSLPVKKQPVVEDTRRTDCFFIFSLFIHDG